MADVIDSAQEQFQVRMTTAANDFREAIRTAADPMPGLLQTYREAEMLWVRAPESEERRLAAKDAWDALAAGRQSLTQAAGSAKQAYNTTKQAAWAELKAAA